MNIISSIVVIILGMVGVFAWLLFACLAICVVMMVYGVCVLISDFKNIRSDEE